MIRSNSDTTTTASTASPTPVSPFSSDYSVPSEPTSDETPDLGAFNAVLRAWSSLQRGPRIINSTLAQQTTSSTTSSSQATTSSSDIREDKPTVWSHRPIANYLSLSDPITTDAESTDRDRPRMVEIQDVDDELDNFYDHDDTNDDNDHDDSDEQLHVRDLGLHDVEEQPSLGYLDEALKFIAAERERFTAQRENGVVGSFDSRRKRRRKRNKTPRAQSTTRTPTISASPSISTITASTTLADDVDVDDADAVFADADDSSSSVDQQSSPNIFRASKSAVFNSTPGTPSRRGRGRGRKLMHSRSTPQLRLIRHEEEEDEDEEEQSTDSVTEDSPRVQKLKSLGKKLEALFPEDREYLKRVQYRTMSPPPAASGPHQSTSSAGYLDPVDSENPSKNIVLGGFVDTRGDPPKKTATNDERLIHVFVDHSNILIGLINYLRRYPRQHPQYRDSPSKNSQYQMSTSATFASPLPSVSPRPFSSPYPKPPKHLSHSALSLILERGRPVTRRIMVASSPLYQPMDGAESLGYEVRIFARVPDTGDGMDREKSNSFGNGKHKKSQSNESYGAPGTFGSPAGDSSSSQTQRYQRHRAGSMNNHNNGFDYNQENNSSSAVEGGGRKKFHSRKVSGNSSTESEQSVRLGGLSAGFLRNSAHLHSFSLPVSHTSTPPPSASSLAPAAVITPSTPQQQRVRYREQGVDELLQLKLHQVLASIDGPPPKGSTIILATGDGNVGQFNEEGFLGGVRTALKRGWKVELYAWEGGLSRAWKREFGEGSEWGGGGGSGKRSSKKKTAKSSVVDDDGPRFRVIGIEQFGSELVELYY
ncbi:hypothetical protein C8R42DRAFT_780303 [Lentinula raphanica]|nr:hypothetical protein C8R42DRAFT_780303 [Lentinula raphanica]